MRNEKLLATKHASSINHNRRPKFYVLLSLLTNVRQFVFLPFITYFEFTIFYFIVLIKWILEIILKNLVWTQ